MTKALSERKKRELMAMADAVFESVMAVEMAARARETREAATRAR